MVYEEVGNLITGDYPVFCHQVNCKGMMGAGLAKQIRNKYPEVYQKYRFLCGQGDAKTGMIQHVSTDDDRICINMFAQYSYGRDRVYTNYDAFRQCLEQIDKLLSKIYVTGEKKIAFPKYIGCGLAGGDWNKIYKMLEEFSEHTDWKVVIVRLE